MSTHPTISTLFLDIGGVLLTNGWDHTMRRRAAKEFGLDYEVMNERHHLTFDTYEEGKLSLKDYLRRVVFYQERDFSLDDFRQYVFAQSKPYQETIELVCSLKEKYGLKTAAVSNEGRELTVHRIDTFDLGAFIQFFISSCFVHYRKPDEDMYRIALDIAQVRPEEVVYIEDRPMFVEVAEGLGIHGIVHRGFEPTRAALEQLGLKLGG
ncbi:MAG: HAD family hydrolase [Anaerolineae bacterium]|jgi:putative hydrolase of the HAD superfamily